MKRLFISLVLVTAAFCQAVAGNFINVTTDNTSLVLGTNAKGQLVFYNYGPRICDLSPLEFFDNYRRSDHGTDPLAYPASGGRYFNEAALSVEYADGALNTELVYDSVLTQKGDGVHRTIVTLKDPKTDLVVELYYDAYQKEDVIVCHSEIINGGKKSVVLHNYYSSAITLNATKYLLTHFYGGWAHEMMVDRELLTHGTKSIESKVEVRTTHMENPSFMLSLDTDSFDENSGQVVAGSLAWSGNFKLNFQMDETGQVNVISGINPYAGAYTLEKGGRFVTPEMIYTFSCEGAGRASRNLHDWARRGGIYAKQFTPTLLNSWEGAYFDFTTKTLTDMIDDAHSMGLEMFVLDDGWFGMKYPRNNSKQGLGDWMLNTNKLPEGIQYIADYAHGKGMKFGIWIEPEMVNPRSELFERHPDWVVGEKGREMPTQRTQHLLDLTNPAVQDFVFEVFDNTMKLAPGIDYIKWDANRHVENVGSNYLKNQTHFWVDYVQGFYSVVRRIREKYPDVMVQACASGGGRVEYGALKYFNEFWTSDDTEARQRAFIQYGTNMIYPAIVTGSHVSEVPNHQSKNITPLKFRFDMACSGRLGIELQPKILSDEEKAFARRAIESYKNYRDIIQDGDLYRLLSPYETDFYSVMYVSKDKKRAVMFAYSLEYHGRVMAPHVHLYGLDPSLKYTIKEQNVDKSGFWGDGRTFGGDFLVSAGVNLPLKTIYASGIYLLEAK